jgi:hypothetical protein
MRKLNLGEWCRELERQIGAVKPVITMALNEIGEAAVEIAREKIGHYQEAIPPFPAWAPLTEATKADRAHQGYPEDEPLLRRGDLRDSIGHRVEPLLLEVGSTDPVMRWDEFGTPRMPPRPVLGPTMIEIEPFAREVLGAALVDVLSGGGGVGRTLSRGAKAQVSAPAYREAAE